MIHFVRSYQTGLLPVGNTNLVRMLYKSFRRTIFGTEIVVVEANAPSTSANDNAKPVYTLTRLDQWQPLQSSSRTCRVRHFEPP